MCRLKFRLLAALLTFCLGVAAVSVLNALSSTPVGLEDVPAPSSPGGQPDLSGPRVAAPDREPCGCACDVGAWDKSYIPVPGTTTQRVIAGGVLQGRAISKPQPSYPPIAKAARASGVVTVQIVVGEEGRVISARAVSGHPLLQMAAIRAACQARFTPTLLSGQPVKVSGTITYNFMLQ